MSRRDVTVAATALLKQGIFHWPSLKTDSLLFSYNNIDSVFKDTIKGKITKEEEKEIQTLIKLEIVLTTIHCAEILASYLLAFEKQGKTIQRTLFKYQVKEVKDFYGSIKKQRMSYIAKIFSYPQPYRVKGQEAKDLIKKSCAKIKKILIEIAEYYNTNTDLYNSYKHGMRISSFMSGENPEESHGIIGYLTPHRTFYPAKVTFTRIDHKKAVELTRTMTNLLLNSKNNFSNKILDNKRDSVVLY